MCLILDTWADRRARRRLLAQLVANAERVLELPRQSQKGLPQDGTERDGIVDGADCWDSCCSRTSSARAAMAMLMLMLLLTG